MLTDMRLIQRDADVYRTWAAGLADLSEPEIRRGAQNARDFTGYFSLPAFRELCKVTPENLGLPDARKAYLEACNAPAFDKDRHTWSHPAVYHAARECGWFELANLTEAQAFPRFKHAYDMIVRRVMEGEPLDMPVPKALPSKITRYLTPEENKARMAALRESLGL